MNLVTKNRYAYGNHTTFAQGPSCPELLNKRIAIDPRPETNSPWLYCLAVKPYSLRAMAEQKKLQQMVANGEDTSEFRKGMHSRIMNRMREEYELYLQDRPYGGSEKEKDWLYN